VKSTDQRPIWSRPLFNLNLTAWQRLGTKYGRPTDRRLQSRILLQGALVSATGRFQELQYGKQIEALSLEAPVFILGHWRSGTTLLHEILALDKELATPTTHQCLNLHSFLFSLNGLVHRGAPIVRPAGDRLVSSASPQEEEFAPLPRSYFAVRNRHFPISPSSDRCVVRSSRVFRVGPENMGRNPTQFSERNNPQSCGQTLTAQVSFEYLSCRYLESAVSGRCFCSDSKRAYCSCSICGGILGENVGTIRARRRASKRDARGPRNRCVPDDGNQSN
jgi:hypothetical protein